LIANYRAKTSSKRRASGSARHGIINTELSVAASSD
jgi:hypothetical protein